MVFVTATIWPPPMTKKANLSNDQHIDFDGNSERSYQYIQPIADPTPRSIKRRGNSIIGALTGSSAVISPRPDMTDATTDPMRM